MSNKINKVTLQVFEVLQRASGLNDDQQAEVFNEYPYPALAQVLQIYFGDFKYNIPDTPPPGVTASSEESHPTNMHKLFRTSHGLAPFIKGQGFDDLNQFQIERRYVQYLEGIHPKDAEMVVALFVGDGRFERLYQISQAAAHKVFPGAVPAPAEIDVRVTEGSGDIFDDLDIPRPEATTLELRPEMEATTVTLPAVENESVSIDLTGTPVDATPGFVLDDYTGPVTLSGDVDAEYDFANLNQHSFEELRRAVMRENHKRKQEAK